MHTQCTEVAPAKEAKVARFPTLQCFADVCVASAQNEGQALIDSLGWGRARGIRAICILFLNQCRACFAT